MTAPCNIVPTSRTESACGCSLRRASRSWSIDSRPSPSGIDRLCHHPAPHRAKPRSWPHLRPGSRSLLLHAPRTTVVGHPELRRVSWTQRLLSRPPAHLAGDLDRGPRHSILGRTLSAERHQRLVHHPDEPRVSPPLLLYQTGRAPGFPDESLVAGSAYDRWAMDFSGSADGHCLSISCTPPTA